ncbi:hypothetical protein LEN26_019775 [Aphanomyces euteiches]|nr:hypothetical protein LEN26_019775 [Aphanomyces euteiches]KAH9112209.1 hypothetical protein AeMF1_013445 [Aphanomyces euteiches]KAH9193725.1 hypothetical protein AeNC1_004305 [Aphanomyces euteiches]
MQRVAAFPAGPSVQLVPTPARALLLSIAGYIYLLFTVTCSCLYLYTLEPIIRNDHWWPGFNTSGTQTFISDVFNAKLIAGEAGDFTLLGITREKDYSAVPTFIDMRRAAGRRLLLAPIPPATAIQVLRRNVFSTNIHTMTPYCWVDFQRRWELAHTAKRQERCLARDSQNAAVYLEALLRNSLNWTSSQFYQPLRTIIFNDVNATAAGQAWLSQLLSFEMVSVDNEIAVWHQYNLTAWTSQVQNLFQEGFDDAIDLVNALGVRQQITITSIPDALRGLSAWSTSWAYAGFWNDLFSCQDFNCSLVRGSLYHPEQLGLDWDKDIFNSGFESPSSRLVRTQIGSFETIDIRFVAPPPSLIQLYSAFDNSYKALAVQSPVTFDAVPMTWQIATFCSMGGTLYAHLAFLRTLSSNLLVITTIVDPRTLTRLI